MLKHFFRRRSPKLSSVRGQALVLFALLIPILILFAGVGLDGAVTGKFNSAGTELTVKVGSTAVAVLKDFGDTSTFNVTSDGKNFTLTK